MSVLQNSHALESGKNHIGDNQPPKKQIDVIAESQSILLYSAKKNMANDIEAYYTLYPATISAYA
jgi:hypothetical protein